MQDEYELYHCTHESHGKGMFYYTECGNRMYLDKSNPMLYHGKLCPKCLSEGKNVVLYMCGTKDAERVLNNRQLHENKSN